MASASKTPNLNLPQWVGTEKQERTDFNAAFDAIDTTVASHLAENVSQGNPHGIDAKANKEQEPWKPITLLNGWENQFSTAQYFKDEFGIVYVTGYIKNGTIANGTTLFTVPVSYRPLYPFYIYAIKGTDDIALLFVNTNGSVSLGSTGGTPMIFSFSYRAGV